MPDIGLATHLSYWIDEACEFRACLGPKEPTNQISAEVPLRSDAEIPQRHYGMSRPPFM